MYESYTHQALPSKKYRELIGTAICVFNSNNSFVIENILRGDQTGQYEWHKLIDKVSGRLSGDIEQTITANSDATIAQLFSDIVDIRNRIVHSFQITAPAGVIDDVDNQMLATKHRDGRQERITEEYLMNFIKLNEELSTKLHQFRGF
ncbi:selenium binding protein [Acinetobacter halotolerans]|uniref:Selenium binding protein n=1 Tax=Acinetobacter halotolerans TaxID=1752076 RepID=A0A4Q6X9V5_9GAMM|nr:selenium binding protein [Acinetobacter halotolerans]RZF51115.1 selenium binding protein [Acinetobacter halotolerans]